MSTPLSKFPVTKLNEMLDSYRHRGYPFPLPKIASYREFVDAYPVTVKSDLRNRVEQMSALGLLPPAYIVATTGTSGRPTVSLCGIWQGESVSPHALDLRRFVGRYIFNRGDVVANCLAAGGLGSLYEGLNRVLEPLGVTIVPMGRLDATPNLVEALSLLSATRTDTVVATPSGLIELARATLTSAISLNIRKLVFIGEPLSDARRRYLSAIWPESEFYGLYGATEAGLVGLTTPDQDPNSYLILSRWVFAEQDVDGQLLITDLSAPPVPLLRYRIGDLVSPVRIVPTRTLVEIKLLGRGDKKFNLVGNLLSEDLIRAAVTRCSADVAHIQIALYDGLKGREHMHLAIDTSRAAKVDRNLSRILAGIRAIPQIEEGISRGVLSVTVGGVTTMRTNGRGKIASLIDSRGEKKSTMPQNIAAAHGMPADVI